MDIEVQLRSCSICGAVTGLNEESTWEKHAAWHERTDRYIENLYLAACNETQARLDRVIREQR